MVRSEDGGEGVPEVVGTGRSRFGGVKKRAEAEA